MAKIYLPETFENMLPRGEAFVLQQLIRLLPGDENIIWCGPSVEGTRPDFVIWLPNIGLIVWEDKGVNFVRDVVEISPSLDRIVLRGNKRNVSPVTQLNNFKSQIGRAISKSILLIGPDLKPIFPVNYVASFSLTSREAAERKMEGFSRAIELCGFAPIFKNDLIVDDTGSFVESLQQKIKYNFSFIDLSKEQIKALEELICPIFEVSPNSFEFREYEKPRLDEQQQAAVEEADKNVLVVAGPGSGKTDVVVRRVAELKKRGRRPLALSFSRRAAQEISLRVHDFTHDDDLAASCSTFHSFCHGILKKNVPNLVVWTEEEKMEVRSEMPSPHLRFSGFEPTESGGSNGGVAVAKTYQELLVDVLKLIEAGLYHPKDHFDDLVVDECQDMGDFELSLVKAFFEDGCKVFLVGDEDQSIYGFRGAKPHWMMRFEDDFSPSGVHVLERNYRVRTKGLVDFTNWVIDRAARRRPHKSTAVCCGDSAVRPKMIFLDNVVERNRFLLELVERFRIEARDLHEIAFISSKRVSGGSLDIYRFLRAENVPCQLVGRDELLENSFKMMHGILKLLAWADDKASVTKLMRFRGLSPAARSKILSDFDAINQFVKEDDLIRRLKANWENGLSVRQLLDCIIKDDAFVSFVVRTAEGRARDMLDDLFAYISALPEDDCEIDKYFESAPLDLAAHRGDPDGVIVTNAHQVKGKEYQIVVLVDVSEDHWIWSNRSDVEEQRRLFYVAVTRAKEQLYLLKPSVGGDGDVFMSGAPDEILEREYCYRSDDQIKWNCD